MAEKSGRTTHRDAVDRVRQGRGFSVNVPVVGRVKIPPPDHLAYYGALGVLAAFEIVDWPIALIVAAGHAMAEQHHNRFAQEVGDALEQA
jgi:xanthosine utilization system XapX-like protein